jgi:hypothetical protein
MLALDDPLWGQLEHAYGKASDIPGYLRILAKSTEPTESIDAEPWYTLWSKLCHQDDVYTASYAAVPHLVHIAASAKGPIDSSFLQLPAAIEAARHFGRGPEIPDVLAHDYHEALRRLSECVSLQLKNPWDRSMLRVAAAAAAVAKGHPDVAEALLNLDDDWISRINSEMR